MKKILLITLSIFVIYSTTYANEITILSPDDEGSDVIEVLIKGKGGYCSLWMDSLGDVQETDCIRLTNSKKVKILCTKKKKICKTEKEVYAYLVKKLSSDSALLNEEENIEPRCKNDNNLILKNGEYSWFTANAEASIIIKKNTDGLYSIKGTALSGTGNQYGPKIGELEFTAPMICGTLVYKEDDYALTIKALDDGNFNVEDEGFIPAHFSGHFVLNARRSISFKKEKLPQMIDNQIDIYQRVYFDNLSIFPMDYYNKNIKMKCGLGGTQIRYVDKGEISDKIDGFIVDTYCELEKEVEGNSYMKNPLQVLLFVPNTTDGRGKRLAKQIHNASGKLFMFKGVFIKIENLFMNYSALIIEEIEIKGKAPATSFMDIFK